MLKNSTKVQAISKCSRKPYIFNFAAIFAKIKNSYIYCRTGASTDLVTHGYFTVGGRFALMSMYRLHGILRGEV